MTLITQEQAWKNLFRKFFRLSASVGTREFRAQLTFPNFDSGSECWENKNLNLESSENLCVFFLLSVKQGKQIFCHCYKDKCMNVCWDTVATEVTEIKKMDIALKKNPKSCFYPNGGLVMKTMEVNAAELLPTQPFMWKMSSFCLIMISNGIVPPFYMPCIHVNNVW